jgi:protein-S-isoprenylcysteine O-methyltransferase Ste14
MVQRLSRFSVGQTAKVLGLLYGLMGLIFLPFFLIPTMLSRDGAGFSPWLALSIPILYGVFGFIFTAVGCALYNWVARRVGGIEISLDAAAERS